MDIETLPYRAIGNEFAKFTEAADKTLTQRLFICLLPAFRPSEPRNEQRGKNKEKKNTKHLFV